MSGNYESHRSLIDPSMKRRLDELMKTANQYKTKACGMHGMMGLIGPTSVDIEEQRNRRRRMPRKPPIPKSGATVTTRNGSGSRSRSFKRRAAGRVPLSAEPTNKLVHSNSMKTCT